MLLWLLWGVLLFIVSFVDLSMCSLWLFEVPRHVQPFTLLRKPAWFAKIDFKWWGKIGNQVQQVLDFGVPYISYILKIEPHSVPKRQASWDATVALRLGPLSEINSLPGACNLGCSVGDYTMLGHNAGESLLKIWICLQNSTPDS